jgi:hypothetical protein
MKRFKTYKINKLKSFVEIGYTQVPDYNGGDNDFICVDNDRKEWIYCENGFYPFCDEKYLNRLANSLKESTLEKLCEFRS